MTQSQLLRVLSVREWVPAWHGLMRHVPARATNRSHKAFELFTPGHISVLRNPDIAHVLYLRGMMEKIGRGSLLILNACLDRNLPLPTWSTDALGVTLTFHAPEPDADFTDYVADRSSATPQQTSNITPSKHRHAAGEVTGEATGEVAGEVTGEVRRLLAACKRSMKRTELQQALGLRHEDHFRNAYLTPALKSGLIEMTIPDKPRSSKQKYRLTAKGMDILRQLGADVNPGSGDNA